MALRFRRFQSRLIVLFLVPLIGVLSTSYFVVSRAYVDNAFNLITQDLRQSAANFEHAIAEKTELLAIAGDAFSDDFAFRRALATRDRATILSALDNLLSRLEGIGDFISIVRYNDSTVVANTLSPDQSGHLPQWLHLIEQARALDLQGEYPEASAVMVLEGRPYRIIVLPFLNPALENWVTVGFEIDESVMGDALETVSAELTVLFRDNDEWHINASTLHEGLHQELTAEFNNLMESGLNSIISLGAADYVSLAKPINADGSVEILLQRSLAEELQPFNELRTLLLQIFGIGITIILGTAILVSRNVTRPVNALAAGAHRIAEGDYSQKVELPQQDEIGQLANAFNDMALGLAEKEKVRDLLGKVVSPEIANELMSKTLELGGEEKDVTLLFADIRGFTSLCEGQSPQRILSLLNEYFSTITGVIERHGGVVDKYIGDAVMALFGAPLQYQDAPERAVRAALDIHDALDKLNLAFATRGLKPIGIGIGINTDRVVVGNMGSRTRLNYTAIGDGVNLASRLESLTVRYGARTIVSEQTRDQAPGFHYLELDKVRVKGKQQPVRIFAPLTSAAQADGSLLRANAAFEEFLSTWYAGHFAAAASLLEHYAALPGHNPVLLRLYKERLERAGNQAPAEWDGVSIFTEK